MHQWKAHGSHICLHLTADTDSSVSIIPYFAFIVGSVFGNHLWCHPFSVLSFCSFEESLDGTIRCRTIPRAVKLLLDSWKKYYYYYETEHAE